MRDRTRGMSRAAAHGSKIRDQPNLRLIKDGSRPVLLGIIIPMLNRLNLYTEF